MNKFKSPVLCTGFVIFLILFSPLQAAIINVTASDADDLKRAVEVSANAGDVIVLPAGTYSLASEIAWPNLDNISIQGASSANTIIDGQSSVRHININAGYTLTINIENVTMVDGYTSTDGGSIYANSGVRINIKDSILSSNYAVEGGFIYSGIVEVENSKFNNNSSSSGGVFYESNVLVDNSLFYGNRASYWGGVGLSSSVTINNSDIINNHSGSWGGVFSSGAWGIGSAYVSNSNIIGNYVTNASNAYGGVFQSMTTVLENCMISGNYAIRSDGAAMIWGGVFYAGTNKLTNCIIKGNYTDAGTSNSYGGVFYRGTNEIIQCLIYNNTSIAANVYGGVFNAGDNEVVQSTIAKNSHDIYYDDSSSSGIADGNMDAYNSIFHGQLNSSTGGPFNNYNCAFSDSVLPTGTDENNQAFITANFIDYDNNNFIISVNSTALDNGSNTYWNANSENILYDMTGYPRIMGVTIDIGAYEIPIPPIVDYMGKKKRIKNLPTTFNWIKPELEKPEMPAIIGYEYYFGQDEAGEVVTGYVTTQDVTIPTADRKWNYLRIRSKNAANLVSPWNTVYEYLLIRSRIFIQQGWSD